MRTLETPAQQGGGTNDRAAPAATTSTKPHDYRPDIDGLRAVAVMSVLIYHADSALIPGGFAGVDIFFVISGYLISGIIFRELDRGSFTCAAFYARRVRRIFPALVLMLLATWAGGWLLLLTTEFRDFGRQFAAGAAFAFNLNVYRDNEWYFSLGTDSPLLHLWSLGIEEQFYIVWPLFVLAIWKTPRARLPLILLITLSSFVLSAASLPTDPLASFYLPWNRLWQLSVGALLAYAELYRHQLPVTHLTLSTSPRASLWRAVIGASFILISFAAFDGSGAMPYPGWRGLLPSLGAVLLISAGPGSWLNEKILANRWFVFIGLLSYPLYLWHMPILSFQRLLGGTTAGGTLCSILLSFCLAFITHRYVETRVRAAPRRAYVVAGLATAMGVCAILGFTAATGVVQARSASYRLDKLANAGVEDWLPGDNHQTGSAHWTINADDLLMLGNASRRVLFTGDSFMQQYYQRVAKLLADHPENSRSAVFAVRGGCAPGGVEQLHRLLAEAYVASCRAFLEKTFQYARQPSIETVVVAGSWYAYFSVRGSTPAHTPWQPGSQEGLTQLQQTLSELVHEGKQVYLVLSHPTGPLFKPEGMIKRSLLPPAFTTEPSEFVPRGLALNADPRIADKLREIAAAAGAHVIDPMELLCSQSSCRAVASNGVPLYRDASHLSPSYVRENVTFLDETILDSPADPGLTSDTGSQARPEDRSITYR